MDRFDVLTLMVSALFSFVAYFAANNRHDVEYITFEEPIVITADLKN